MQKLSKSKFQTKCNELGINSKQSIFFKTGFFQKFGCSSFCHLHTIKISAKTNKKLIVNFKIVCQKYLEKLQNSNNILIHFRVNENFLFILVQEMMETLQKSVTDETSVTMDISYVNDKVESKVVLFLEEY